MGRGRKAYDSVWCKVSSSCPVESSHQPYSPQCPNPFHLLIPHICPPGYPSSTGNPKTPLPPSFRVSPPPPRQPEAFPASTVDQPNAGPSTTARSRDKPNGEATGKRKSRRNSNESSSRILSPSRAASPSQERRKDKDKKRPKSDETESTGKSGKGKEKADDAMSVDSEPRKKARTSNGRVSSPPAKGKNNPEKLNVRKERRSRSPMIMQRDEEEDDDQEEEEDEEAEEVEEVEDNEARDLEKKVKEEKMALEDVRRRRPSWIDTSRIKSYREHRDVVMTVAWNPKNPEVLATGSSDGTARLWDFKPQSGDSRPVELARKPYVISHKSIESNRKAVTAVAWHPDGTVLATGRFKRVEANFSNIQARMTVQAVSSHHLANYRESCHTAGVRSTLSNSHLPVTTF